MEKWKDINGFYGYQVSNLGRVRSFWRKKRRATGYGCDRVLTDVPTLMSLSDDGNGYLKVMLQSRDNSRRYCKKVHRLVAEAFLPNDDLSKDTVDHVLSGRDGKLDNSVYNLRWISRSDNIRKAYRDGVCDQRIERQNKDIMCVDLWTGEELYFSSIKEASTQLGIDRSSISHVLIGDSSKTSHYTFEYADGEDRLLYGNYDY